MALELDGPSHFLRSLKEKEKGEGEESRRDGPSKAKIRLMESLGWKVLRFSWLNRIKLGKKPEEERREFWVKELGKLGVETDK